MTDNINKIKSLIGFAKKANAIICGGNASISAIQTHKAKLILIANNVSDRTQKQLSDKCISHNVKLVLLPLSNDELGHIVGKDSPISSLAITNEDFAIGFAKLIEDN